MRDRRDRRGDHRRSSCARPLARRRRRVGDSTAGRPSPRCGGRNGIRRRERPQRPARALVRHRVHRAAGTCSSRSLLLWLMYLRFLAVSREPRRRARTWCRSSSSARARRKEAGRRARQPTAAADSREPPRQPPQRRPRRAGYRSRRAVPHRQPRCPRRRMRRSRGRQRDVPEPQLPRAARWSAAGRGQRTPTPSEPTVFVLPPTRRATAAAPQLAAPELSAHAPTVQRGRSGRAGAADPPRHLPQREIAAPRSSSAARSRRARRAGASSRRAPVRALPHAERRRCRSAFDAPSIRTAAVAAAADARRRRRRHRPPPARAAPAARATAAGNRTDGRRDSPQRRAARGRRPRHARRASSADAQWHAAGCRRGGRPEADAAPGRTWSTPTRGDDWGESTRNRPGGQRGERPGSTTPTAACASPRHRDRPRRRQPPPAPSPRRSSDLDRAGTWLQAQAERLRADQLRQVLGAERNAAGGVGAQGHQEGGDSDSRHQQEASNAWSRCSRWAAAAASAIRTSTTSPHGARPPPDDSVQAAICRKTTAAAAAG